MGKKVVSGQARRHLPAACRSHMGSAAPLYPPPRGRPRCPAAAAGLQSGARAAPLRGLLGWVAPVGMWPGSLDRQDLTMLREPRPLRRFLRWHHGLFVLCCWGRFKIQLIAEWPVLAKSLTLCGLEPRDTGPPQALGVVGRAGSPWGHCPCPPLRVGAPAPRHVPAPGSGARQVPGPCPPQWGGTALLSSPLHPCTFPPATEDQQCGVLAACAAAASGGL